MPYIFGKLWHLAIIWAIRKAFQCILQGVRILLAKYTRISPTSENESQWTSESSNWKILLIWFHLVEDYCCISYDSLHRRGQKPWWAKAESGVCQSNCDSPQPSNRLPPPLEILLPPPLEILFPQPRKYFTTDSQRRAAADQPMLRSQLGGSFVEFADIICNPTGNINCMNYLHCLVVADYKLLKKMQSNE